MRVKLKKCDGECAKETVIWKQFEGKRYCRDCWSKIKPTASISRGNAPLKQRTPIPKQSPRRKKLDAAYSALRKDYLDKHPNCELVCSPDCTHISTDIHHVYWAGDREEFMNDFSEVKAGCRNCHNHVHTKMSAEEAIERGFKKVKR